jgi:hypothetical protein
MESVIKSNNFYKQFLYEKNKLLVPELERKFREMNFIDNKGTDVLKRQLLFFYLDFVDFFSIDNEHFIDPFIIYLSNCKYLCK